MSVRIRAAEPGDVPWILEQLRAFDRFFGTRTPIFPDEEYATTTLRQLIAGGPFFVAEQEMFSARIGIDPTRVYRVGFIAGLLAPHWMNPSIRVLSELLWWVDERHRGTSAGARLMAAYVAYGREHADWILTAIGRQTPVHARSLERHGFVRYEQHFLLEVAS